jgi:ATP-dependent DNA ligase
MARRDAAGVRLITRNGNDFTQRFPFITMAVGALPVRLCLIDGEAIVCDETGLAVFDLIRGHRTFAGAVHCAFDLLESRRRGSAAAADRDPQGTAREAPARLASEHRSQ